MTDLDRVREFRYATRRVLTELDGDERATALIRLKDRAKVEDLAAWCLRAIVAEIGWHHERADVLQRRILGDRTERRHRQMRGRGLSSCPECLSPLSNETDWQTWAELRKAAILEAEARDADVPATETRVEA